MVYTNTGVKRLSLPRGEGLDGGCAKRSATSSRQKRLRHDGLHEYRSEATKPSPAGKVWMGVVQSGESPLPDKKGSITEPFLSGRGDSNTRPLRPERSALANCATSRELCMS